MLDVCMRLPALVIMDSILSYTTEKPGEPPDDDTGQDFDFYSIYSTMSDVCLKIFVLVYVFRLKSDELVRLYTVSLKLLLSCWLLWTSFRISQTLAAEQTAALPAVLSMSEYLTDSAMFNLAVKILLQGGISTLLECCVPVRKPEAYLSLLRRTMFPFLASPCLVFMVYPSSSVLSVMTSVSLIPASLLVLVFLVTVLGAAWTYLDKVSKDQWEIIGNFGIYYYLETEWARLRVPTVLRSYFFFRLLLVGYQSWDELASSLYPDTELILVRSCESYVALLALTSVISSAANLIGTIFQLILQSAEDEKSVGNISAVLFFILALQTGLPDLPPEKRFFQLCKNSCLLVTAILHCIHSMVQTVLQSLASSTTNRSKHARALSVCGFLSVFPMLLTYLLWSHFMPGTWLLAVTAFCVEAVIKVLVTCLIYSLTMWDIYCQEGVWESFDDWIYAIRSFGNCVQFVFAVFLFFNGGWVLVFESGGSIRAVMMIIHAYYNIWCEAKAGWTSFWKRRTALIKVTSLTDATPDQISKHNDVCAICYQEMSAAKITRCKHMFHYSCLTKWLYKQDSCPMCLELLHKVDATCQTEPDVPDLQVDESDSDESDEEDVDNDPDAEAEPESSDDEDEDEMQDPDHPRQLARGAIF